MLKHDSIQDYLKVGPQRLADARELLEKPTWNPDARDAGHRHLSAAVYLACYAVECALKVYIIAMEIDALQQGDQSLTAAVDARNARGETLNLSGKRAHNLRVLRGVTDLEARMDADETIKKCWGAVSKWTTDWRYDPKPYTSHCDARALVDAADALRTWIDDQRSDL